MRIFNDFFYHEDEDIYFLPDSYLENYFSSKKYINFLILLLSCYYLNFNFVIILLILSNYSDIMGADLIFDEDEDDFYFWHDIFGIRHRTLGILNKGFIFDIKDFDECISNRMEPPELRTLEIPNVSLILFRTYYNDTNYILESSVNSNNKNESFYLSAFRNSKYNIAVDKISHKDKFDFIRPFYIMDYNDFIILKHKI